MGMRHIVAVALLMMPMLAQAEMPSDKLGKICKTNSSGCEAYTLGGADRFWLAKAGHNTCDATADKKTLEALKKAVKGNTNIYAAKAKQSAAVTLLAYLGQNNLQSCALSANFTQLTALCMDTKNEAAQIQCHAYVSGVLDMAVEMDKINQRDVKKAATYTPPFCENGAPKENLTDAEIMKAIGEYGEKNMDAVASQPAAKVVMQALLTQYRCEKK